jgi:hypothetical protein
MVWIPPGLPPVFDFPIDVATSLPLGGTAIRLSDNSTHSLAVQDTAGHGKFSAGRPIRGRGPLSRRPALEAEQAAEKPAVRLAGHDGRADENEAEAAGNWLTAPDARMRLLFCLCVHDGIPCAASQGMDGEKPVRGVCARRGFAWASGEAARSALDKAQHHE